MDRRIFNPPDGVKEFQFHSCSNGMIVAYICDEKQHEVHDKLVESLTDDTDMFSAVLLFAFVGIQSQTLPGFI